MLVRSITGQQLSVKAAATIWGRLVNLNGSSRISRQAADCPIATFVPPASPTRKSDLYVILRMHLLLDVLRRLI